MGTCYMLMFLVATLALAAGVPQLDAELQAETNLDESIESAANPTKLPICDCDCGVANPLEEKIGLANIVDGEQVAPNQYPWLVRLIIEVDFWMFFTRSKQCGGSLINKDYVLTAAHCVRDVDESRVTVWLGQHGASVIGSETQRRRVSEIVSEHKEGEVVNDIALLRLQHPVQFNKAISPICQPSKDMVFGGKTGTAVGWGITSDDGSPHYPLQADVPIYSDDQCLEASRIFENKKGMDGASRAGSLEHTLCAGGKSRGVCFGDSGGPLQVKLTDGRYVLAGITSWGAAVCGLSGIPDFYMNVAKFQDWIIDNMRDTCVCKS